MKSRRTRRIFPRAIGPLANLKFPAIPWIGDHLAHPAFRHVSPCYRLPAISRCFARFRPAFPPVFLKALTADAFVGPRFVDAKLVASSIVAGCAFVHIYASDAVSL